MRRWGALVLIGLVVVCGCATTTPRVSSMNFAPGAMEAVGPAKGESTETTVLCLIPMGNGAASISAATEAAVASVGGEALINTVVDDERGVGFLGLWCYQTIRVSGLAVRFKTGYRAGRMRATDKGSDRTIEDMEMKAIGN